MYLRSSSLLFYVAWFAAADGRVQLQLGLLPHHGLELLHGFAPVLSLLHDLVRGRLHPLVVLLVVLVVEGLHGHVHRLEEPDAGPLAVGLADAVRVVPVFPVHRPCVGCEHLAVGLPLLGRLQHLLRAVVLDAHQVHPARDPAHRLRALIIVGVVRLNMPGHLWRVRFHLDFL